MIELLENASIALASLSVLFVGVLVARRFWLARRERRRRAGRARVLPLALELLEGEQTPSLPAVAAGTGVVDRAGGGEPSALSPADLRALAEVMAGYARELRGVPRERIARFFEQHGLVAAELDELGSRRAWRRAAAAHLLGDMCSPRAVPGLLTALDDPERDVRSAAARSLGALGAERAVEPLVAALAAKRLPRAVAGQALLSIGWPALPSLREFCESEDADRRAEAVELVGLLGDAEDARMLERRLRDPAAAVRANAAVGLGRLGAQGAAEQLRETLGDRIPFVRCAAAEALGELADEPAIPALAAQAQAEPFEPAQAAARALARMDADLVARATRGAHADGHLREAIDLARLTR